MRPATCSAAAPRRARKIRFEAVPRTPPSWTSSEVTPRHASPWRAAGVRSSVPSTAGEIRPATLTVPVRAVRATVSTGGRESPATRLNQDRPRSTAARHRGITILHARRTSSAVGPVGIEPAFDETRPVHAGEPLGLLGDDCCCRSDVVVPSYGAQAHRGSARVVWSSGALCAAVDRVRRR